MKKAQVARPWRRRLRWQRRIIAILGSISFIGLVVLPAVVPQRYPDRIVPVLAFMTGIGIGGAVIVLLLQDVFYAVLEGLHQGLSKMAKAFEAGGIAGPPEDRAISAEVTPMAASWVDRLEHWLAAHPNVAEFMTNGVSPALTGVLCAIVGAAATLGAVALT